MNNYTIYHCHSDLSNPTTTMDSVTKFKMYIDKAKELNMTAFAFSEHGNVYEYLHKKEYIEQNGMKYIHAVEAYVTKTLDEKVRDNYHVILIARNYEGFKELNYLMSHEVASNREDGHFYYVPRITYDELKNTSDNIIITTACLASILNSGDKELEIDYIQFLANNKHRCFLEIQHHLVKQQISYNKKLLDISNKTGVRLIAGTDTHNLDARYSEGRDILQKAKNTHFENEDGWDLDFKAYEELVLAYKKQNTLSEKDYMKAIQNTNVLANMIEEFEIDRSHKYPKLYDDIENVLKSKIKEGIKSRNVVLDDEKRKRIQHEFNAMKNNGAIDYILLEEDYKSWCRQNNIPYGYSRGSISGSYIAYLLKITEMDSIKHNLIFERFLNPDRIAGLCDIDTDLPPSKRDLVKDYLYQKEGLYCADIITFNTIALKGAIRDVGRALEIPLSEVDEISKNVDTREDKLREKYPELFKYVDLLNGVVVSVGTHPAGVVVSPYPLEDIVGTCTLSTNDYPVTQLNMVEVDSRNFVKLDLLGLDNIEIIDETCTLANIPTPTPDTIDDNDINVWNSIKDSTLGVFQWESNTAKIYYRQLFSDETISKIKSRNPDFKYINLFSMGNGAIRPAGESYRDALATGEYKDNGHEVLNEFLKPTLGYLVFQEQILEFLNKFCGFTMGRSDIVRRGFAKKTGTDEYLPSIKEGFIKTMDKKYGVCKIEAEKIIVDFIKVIEDASSYLFSINHSQSYSYIGYVCAWLRYYYPLEFLTSLLNVCKNDFEKTTNAFEYLTKHTDITLNPAKFRYSSGNYTMDKTSNSIYKGISSIKNISSQLGEELFALKGNQYTSFIHLLYDIKNKTSCNTRELDILIQLDFFSEFGKSQKLLDFIPYFNAIYKAKVINKNKFEELNHIISKHSRETEKQYRDIDNYKILEKIWDSIPNKEISIAEKLKAQTDYLGYIDYANPKIDKKYILVTKLDTKYSPKFIGYCLNNGKTQELKVYKQKRGRGIPGVKTYFKNNPFEDGDLLYTKKFRDSLKSRKTDSGFEKIPNTQEWWLIDYKVVNDDVVNCIINNS